MPARDASIAENTLGTIGGLLLAVCLIPQLWRIYATRSATDLSYGWLALYGLGLGVNTAYLVLAQAPVGAAFHAVELGLVVVMGVAKALLEHGHCGGGGRGGKEAGPAGAAAGAPAVASPGGHPPVPPTRTV